MLLHLKLCNLQKKRYLNLHFYVQETLCISILQSICIVLSPHFCEYKSKCDSCSIRSTCFYDNDILQKVGFYRSLEVNATMPYLVKLCVLDLNAIMCNQPSAMYCTYHHIDIPTTKLNELIHEWS